MTEEQIISLAKICGFSPKDAGPLTYWECWERQLIKFANVIYEEGYEQHRKDILGEELYYD